MRDWNRVTCCPRCGGELEISFYYTFSRDYKITKEGVLSKKFKKSAYGPLHCETAFCNTCETSFGEDEVTIEDDGSVWIRS